MSKRNHETQVVVNWLNKDESSYNFVNELIEEAETKYDAAQMLKDRIYEDADTLYEQANMFKDLLSGALLEVDWLSIIEDFTEE